MTLDRRGKTLLLAKAVEAVFATSEWTELGFLTATEDWIDRHPRLLRSLRWGDEDYHGHVITAVSHILDTDPTNLKRLVQYDPAHLAARLATAAG